MSDQTDGLSIEDKIRRIEGVRQLAENLKQETEHLLHVGAEAVHHSQLDEELKLAQAQLNEQIRRAHGSGTINDAKAAMLKAAGGIFDPVQVPDLPLGGVVSSEQQAEQKPEEQQPEAEQPAQAMPSFGASTGEES